jgi:hypothetical protein
MQGVTAFLFFVYRIYPFHGFPKSNQAKRDQYFDTMLYIGDREEPNQSWARY